MRQLSDEITDLLEVRVPLDADAEKIDLVPDELAECRQILVDPLMPKVEKRHLADQVFHVRSDVLKASPRENRHGGCRVPKIRV
jgi:hypothetical protein